MLLLIFLFLLACWLMPSSSSSSSWPKKDAAAIISSGEEGERGTGLYVCVMDEEEEEDDRETVLSAATHVERRITTPLPEESKAESLTTTAITYMILSKIKTRGALISSGAGPVLVSGSKYLRSTTNKNSVSLIMLVGISL